VRQLFGSGMENESLRECRTSAVCFESEHTSWAALEEAVKLDKSLARLTKALALQKK